MLNKRNLKLGYGGTKTEMERLLADAEKFSGIHYDISNLSDVYNAIHVVQQEMGITGTTAKEASSTIQGSVASMKSAYQNFLTGLANGGADFESLIGNLVETSMTAASNIVPALIEIVNNIGAVLPELIDTLLPQILELIQTIFENVMEAMVTNLPILLEALLNILVSLGTLIIQNLPMFVDNAIKIILSLVDGITKAIPQLIPVIVDVLINIVQTIIDNLPMIIDSAVDIIMALADGLIDAIPKLLEAIPQLIVSLVMAITDPNMILKLQSVGPKLLMSLAKALIQAIPQLLLAVPQIISQLVSSFKERITSTNWLQLGKNILKGILDGMVDFGNIVKDTIQKVGTKITNSIKNFFGIKSPSRLMKKEVGKYLASGIAVGFEDEIPNTIKDVQDAMADLNKGIQASVNPTINPQANTNPLIIQIENFNNSRETDIQALAEELEFYRKNSANATGGA